MSRARQSAAAVILALSAAVAVAALLLVRPSIGRACSPIGPTQHQVDTTLAATDTAAPALTEPTEVQPHISDSEESGCFGGYKCGSGSLINLKVTATDDQSPPDRIGYRLRVVGGTLPPGIFVPQFDTGTFNNLIPLPWNPEASGDNFRFELSVAPLDEAGNVGDAQRVVVQNSDGGGCAIHPGAGGGDPTFRIAALAVLAVAMLMLRRRRGAK